MKLKKLERQKINVIEIYMQDSKDVSEYIESMVIKSTFQTENSDCTYYNFSSSADVQFIKCNLQNFGK